MMDTDDCTLTLDRLFFEKPTIHKVKPLNQDVTPWQLEASPALMHVPATQEMQKEAESLSTHFSFTQKLQMFSPPLKKLHGLKDSSEISLCGLNNEEREADETHGGTSGCEGLYRGEGFTDYFEGSHQSNRTVEESLLDSGHVTSNRWLSQDHRKSPPLRRSLFNIPRLDIRGDLSTKTDSNRLSSSHTMSRLQTFCSRVAMTTGSPALQPPQAAVGLVAPFSPEPPPLDPCAASSRPSQPAGLQDRGTKRALVPPMMPQPLHIQGSSGPGVLRPVSELPVKFRSIFSDFPFFNYVQSKALDDVLYTNRNFVACAPTGSGKTVLFELAIIRLLMETPEPWRDVKAVYMAPIKALCSQCSENWKKKFGPLGLSCKELTGDTEIDDFFEIQDSQIILTTPEKWDSMTRKWKDNCLLQLVKLFLIDEVHVVKDATRGATLEVVVSRMKAVNAYRASQNPEAGLSMRFVAVSATIPNISDLADWLSNESGPATYLSMDENHRPVKLRKVVLGFPCSPNQTEFKFDLSLNYKMANIIQTYSDQKPTLVFCSTRKGVQQSAAVLAKDARFIISSEHKQRLMKYASSILDSKLKDLLMLGIGYHHAGVGLSDRKLIEEAFALGDLPVLFTTRTLAMGVNLPAHLVVIKSTMQYIAGSCEEYGEADILQMIGRAGRPQFDSSATAVIMTKVQTRDKYTNLMNGMEIIESSLHGHLVEHLNAEIVLQTISDVNMALDWIRSTYLYIRALKNPTHYGFSADLDRCGIEAKLQELCLKNLNALSAIDLIRMDEDINIKPTEAGRLMARFCIAFDTMEQFSKVVGTESLFDLVSLVSKSREFSDIQLRVNEKRALNTLNRDKNRRTIRFPLEGKIKTSEMKVNCLIQAQMSSISIQDFGLTQDTAKIFRIGMRISKCLSEFLSHRSEAVFPALLNSLILAKCFRAKIWENSHFVSKQLEKIGQTLSTAMVNAGLTTFSQIEQTNPRELELILNRHPPFGNQIRDSVRHLPKYSVTLEQLPRFGSDTAEVVARVNLKNQADLLSRRTAPGHHFVSLIIGDADNNVAFLQKITDSMLLKSGSWSKKIHVAKPVKGNEISVHLISSDYVGLDIQQRFTMQFSASRTFGSEIPYNTIEQRPQLTAQTPLSAAQRDKASPAEEQGSTYPGHKRQCNHLCKNKTLCAHDCCKVGVAVGRKRSTNHESSFSSYLTDLRNRSDALVQTPVKRLKMGNGPLAVSMQRFAFKSKENLSPVFCYSENEYKAGQMDLAADDSSQLKDISCLNDPDPGTFSDADGAENRTRTTQNPAATQQMFLKDSSARIMSRTGGEPLKSGVNQTKTSTSVHSNWSAATSEQEALQIPAVTFDLGNEWDDWEDFDEENLLHTAAALVPQCRTKPEPQIQQRVDYTSGCPTGSSPVFLSCSQTKCQGTTITTPLRSISAAASCEIRKFDPSPITNILNDEITGKTPEMFFKPPPETQVNRRCDFFHTVDVPLRSDLSLDRSSKEEETFFGIFDGIF
nr:probable ATP-dependent DNA helicase HFM1 isoform X2 [Nothobranchius furzeri]